jgi:peptidase E
MAADGPTVVATSGGFAEGRRSPLAFAPLVHHAVELAQVGGRAPRVSYLGTAFGDQEWFSSWILDAGRDAGWDMAVLRLFPMPSVDDVAAHLLAQDVVWVGGGSVVNLLAVWRAHGLEEIFRRVWEAGVVLGGVSAGSICWHVGGTTDSFGPELAPVVDGLGLLPFGNGVHYDAEPGRRPLLQSLVADGTLPTSYATDDGVGLVYVGTELREAVSESPDALAYRVERGPDGAVETPIMPRLLD